ncbi:MAG: hypothetical protein RLZZ126_824 [Pseudomonadota bacterium]|jgi:hypothetical protein
MRAFFPNPPHFWRDRIQASLTHLGLSLGVAALAALLVFGVWYPYPYSELSGGRELFLILITVDVILGPLITLAVFNRQTKPLTELRRDLAIVALLQLAALGYGLWTVCVSRPVHLVFEYHRFAAVHAINVPEERLPFAQTGLKTMPLTGPTLLSLRDFKDPEEKLEMTVAALGGVSLAARPELWQPYDRAAEQIRKEAKPMAALKQRFPMAQQQIDAALAKHGPEAQGYVYLPMVGRKTFWTVVLDPVSLRVKEFLPLDSF